MIAVSAVLVVIAAVTFVVGVFQDGSTFIIASIAASALAFIALIAGVMRTRKEVVPSIAGIPVGSEDILEEPQMRDATEHQPAWAATGTLLPDDDADEGEVADDADRPLLPPIDKPRTPRAKSTAKRATPKTAAKSTAKTTAKTTAKSAAKKVAAKPATAKPATTAKKVAAKPTAKKVAKPAAKKPAAKKQAKPAPRKS